MNSVLIVDDSDFDRKMIRKAIAANRKDITFIEMHTGKTIAGMTSLDVPSVAIIDIRMPGMDGFDTLKAIRQRALSQDFPILMVSGSEQAEDREMSEAAGADGYYVKPESASAYFSLGRKICDRYL
jgi:CheY-like chemotaxis protein